MANGTVGYRENRFVIMLIGLAGMTAYMLPYLRWYYYDAYMAYFDLTNTQMGIIGSVYGTIAIVGYCLGGWVADRVPLKLVVPGSLVVTGLLGFILLMKPGFGLHLTVYAVWSLTTILTFWNPLMKCLRAMCRPDEQARGYALNDMTRGLLNLCTGFLFVWVFTKITEQYGGSEIAGLRGIILIYSIWAVVVGFITYLALRNRLPDFTKDIKASDANFGRNVLRVLKMPTTWLLIIAMFLTYSVICSYSYVVPYCTAAFGMSAALAAIMGYMAQGFRIVGCWAGGQIADRKGLSNMYLADIILMIVGILGLLFCPQNIKFMWLVVVSIGILTMSMYSAQALHYAVMEEGDFPVETMGAAMFIITPLGYAGESLMPLFNGWALDHFAGVSGYKVMFSTYIVMLIVAAVALLIFRKITTPRRMELAKMREESRRAKQESRAAEEAA